MNVILNDVLKRRDGHYIHALEVNDVDELRDSLISISHIFMDAYKKSEIKDFMMTLDIHCLNDENENEVNCYPVEDWIDDILDW